MSTIRIALSIWLFFTEKVIEVIYACSYVELLLEKGTETYITVARRGAVVEALRYKPEGHGIDFRWCHWNFSLT
jgi:hypothetical protein